MMPAANRVLRQPLIEKDGSLQISDKPGLGIDVDEDAVRELSIEHWVVNQDGKAVQ